MSDARSEKAALRRTLEEAWDATAPDRRARETEVLVGLLSAWVARQGFEVVLATLPLTREPDLTPFFAAWLATGGRLALSRTLPGRTMDFGLVSNVEGPWRVRPFGMKEPLASVPAWHAGPRTLLLVPGVGFAPSGGGAARLGHGAGYFDRWLAQFGAHVTSLGYGLSSQIVDWLPEEAHDQNLDGWLDPHGFHGRFELSASPGGSKRRT